MEIEVEGSEFDSSTDAVMDAEDTGRVAISVGGRYFSVDRSELDRIESQGVQPTKYSYNEATDRIMSAPGRNG